MNHDRATSLVIETPEGVEFSYDLASPVTRALAWMVDTAAIAVLTKGADKLCDWVKPLNEDWSTAVAALLYFAISIGYCIALEWRWHGQTVGKRVMGLRVVDARGLRLELSQIVLRNLMRVVDMLPVAYLVGGLMSLRSRNCQRLGDLAGGTVVARERAFASPDIDEIAPAKYNSLLAYPHLAARLRSLASPAAVTIAVRAASRRDGYEPLARVSLFGELADYFQSLVRFPAEACEGLTGEQYVRSVLRVVFSGGPAAAKQSAKP
jgi:uncharacterized RDD family membrane protein YckC